MRKKRKVLNKLANCSPLECQSKQSGTVSVGVCIQSPMWPQLARGVKRRPRARTSNRPRTFVTFSFTFSLMLTHANAFLDILLVNVSMKRLHLCCDVLRRSRKKTAPERHVFPNCRGFFSAFARLFVAPKLRLTTVRNRINLQRKQRFFVLLKYCATCFSSRGPQFSP